MEQKNIWWRHPKADYVAIFWCLVCHSVNRPSWHYLKYTFQPSVEPGSLPRPEYVCNGTASVGKSYLVLVLEHVQPNKMILNDNVFPTTKELQSIQFESQGVRFAAFVREKRRKETPSSCMYIRLVQLISIASLPFWDR